MIQNEDKNETYKVLLADDEQIERMALAKRLHKHFGDSLVIWQAADGNEAVRLCFKERCQIVIMDISMPELNGVEAAEQIRSMDEDCVIVSFSLPHMTNFPMQREPLPFMRWTIF